MSSIKEIEISKNTKLDLITADGLFLTNEDPSKVMTANWSDYTSYTGDKAEWLNGETKNFFGKKNYYAVCKIGNAPWFIVVEGPISDFKGTLANVIIVFVILMFVFSISASLFNIRTLNKMRQGEQKLADQLFEDAQSLVVSSKENAATAQDQSAAVKEIVATMEDNTALSEDISQKSKLPPAEPVALIHHKWPATSSGKPQYNASHHHDSRYTAVSRIRLFRPY